MAATANLSKTIDLTIFNRVYPCPFPKTGQFIDVQTIKSKLSEDKYVNFPSFGRDGQLGSVFIDAIATFNVLLPQLGKDLNVKGLLDLEIDKILELSDVYVNTYLPWYEQWMELLTTPRSIDAEPDTKETTVNVN